MREDGKYIQLQWYILQYVYFCYSLLVTSHFSIYVYNFSLFVFHSLLGLTYLG
jgi:hypothetical protein